jgi:hypothetical protein
MPLSASIITIYAWQLLDSVNFAFQEHETEDLPMPPLFQFLTVLAFKIFVCEQVSYIFLIYIEAYLDYQLSSCNERFISNLLICICMLAQLKA